MRKLKTTMPIMCALIAVVLAVGTSAFTPTHPTTSKGKLTTLTYYYLPNTLSGANVGDNWTAEDDLPGAPPTCNGVNIPCKLTFETTEFADIDAYMSGKTAANVRDDAAHVIDKP